MDIKRQRTIARVVIGVAILLWIAATANFIYRNLDFLSFVIMVVISFGSVYATILALSTFEATKDESVKEYHHRIKDFLDKGYIISTASVKIVPYLNRRKIMGKNLWGTVQVVREENFEDKKITILLDSFMISEAEVRTARTVSVIRYKEYVVVYDEQNEKSAWLVK